MEEEEKKVLYAAIKWYEEMQKTRDRLSPAETALFCAISDMENTKSIKIPIQYLSESQRATMPAPHKVLDSLVKKSREK